MKTSLFPTVLLAALLLAVTAVAQTATQKAPLRAQPSLQETKETSAEAINDRKSIHGGISWPLDDGRGYPLGYGYFIWKRSAWPCPTADFRLVFAGVAGDIELTMRGLISENTDLGFGGAWQTMGRFEEYDRGQLRLGNRMGLERYSGRIFVQQHLVANYTEIAKVRAAYEFGHEGYYHHNDTAPTFQIATSGMFQTATLNAGTGKLNRSNFSPSGWDFNVGFEATFRDDWQAWGPPNRWDSPSRFQKFSLDGTYVLDSFEEQKLVTKFSGGVGNGVDRLAASKLGGALTGWPNALVMHGYYTREIFAEDYALLNLDYVLPIHEEQELALHFYGDAAMTKRSDIPDRAIHLWSGVGTGVSVKGWWETQWLLGYGYGINAQRGNDNGGHEVFAQMSKQF